MIPQQLAGRTAVVIVTRNRKQTLLACVASVLRLQGQPAEVVVVDNGSTDGSAQALVETFPLVRLVRLEENRGPAGGRNAGWRLIRARAGLEHVLFFDDDSVPAADFLVRLLEAAAANRRAGIVCGKGYTKCPSRTIMSAGVAANLWTGRIADIGAGELDKGQYDAPRELDACGGFGMLVRCDTLEALGGFDERFWPYGWEDIDFCLRARRAGCHVLYVPRAVVYHEGGKIGRKPVPAYERSKVKNYLLLLALHAGLLQKATCALCIPLRIVSLAARLIGQGSAKMLLAHLRGLWDAVGLLRHRPMGKAAGMGSFVDQGSSRGQGS